METFVTDTEEQDFTLDLQTLNELAAMYPLYPELAHWTRFAVFVAWGAYSQDIYAISWVDWMTGHRDEGFLAYCYACQRWPAFDLAGQGCMTRIYRNWQRNVPGAALRCRRLPAGYLQHISYSVGKIPEASGMVIRRDKHGHANRMCVVIKTEHNMRRDFLIRSKHG